MKMIDDYFNNAKLIKDVSQPFNDEELISLMNNSAPSKFQKFVKKFKGLLIMSSILLSVMSCYFIGMFLFAGDIDNQSIGSKTEKTKNYATQQSKSVIVSNNDLLSDNKMISKEKKKIRKNEIQTDNKQNDNDSQLSNNSSMHAVKIITRFTKVDENLELKRPYQIVRKERTSTSFGIATKNDNNEVLEPATIRTNKKGDPIPGIIQLELTNDELAKLGIIVNDSTFSFITEFNHQIHPIPYRNRYDYKISKEVKPYTDSGYLPNGDTFLVKQNHLINLNYQYDSKKDRILNIGNSSTTTWVYKNVDGKDQWVQIDTVFNSGDKSFIGLTRDEAENKIQQSYFGFTKPLINYKGWMKSEYSRYVPVSFAFNYNPVKEKVKEIISKSPLLNPEENNWTLDYSELLPVKINFGKNKLIEKAVLWFVPTNEFIDLLPERYSKSLKNEVTVISGIKNGNINADSACSLIKDVSYLDVCRVKDGVIKIEKIYPHPVYESAELSFVLGEDRKISIDIYDLNGKPLGNFISKKFMEKGNHKQPLVFKNIPSGIYMIAVKSEYDEIATLRIIIN